MIRDASGRSPHVCESNSCALAAARRRRRRLSVAVAGRIDRGITKWWEIGTAMERTSEAARAFYQYHRKNGET